jgi:hypothetical protein
MTTKNFYRVENNIKNELSNPNGEWKVTGEYKTRKEALETIFGILMTEDGSSNLDIANFKIEEVEEVDTFGTLYEVANTIENRFACFEDKFETAHLGNKEDGFLEMTITSSKYPSLNNVELGIIFEVVNGINEGLPEGYEVIFVIDHECRIRLMMSKPENK